MLELCLSYGGLISAPQRRRTQPSVPPFRLSSPVRVFKPAVPPLAGRLCRTPVLHHGEGGAQADSHRMGSQRSLGRHGPPPPHARRGVRDRAIPTNPAPVCVSPAHAGISVPSRAECTQPEERNRDRAPCPRATRAPHEVSLLSEEPGTQAKATTVNPPPSRRSYVRITLTININESEHSYFNSINHGTRTGTEN